MKIILISFFAIAVSIAAVLFEYWPLCLVMLFSGAAIAIWNYKQRNKKQSRFYVVDLSEIDGMSGVDFEKYVAMLLSKNEFENVSCTKASGDYGVDILAERYDETYAFQCKRYSGKLGVKSVQEIYAGAKMYHAEYAIVVTNSYFTPNALKLAGELGVELWDRDKLITIIERADALQSEIL